MTPFCLMSSILILLSSSALFWASPTVSATTMDSPTPTPWKERVSLETMDVGCIRTGDELIKAIAAVPTTNDANTTPYTTIELCRFAVLVVNKPIDLSHKAIDLHCVGAGSILYPRVSCVIDSFISFQNRPFVGSNARLSIRGIVIHQEHVESPLAAFTDLVDSTVTIQVSAFTYTLAKKDNVVTDHGLHGDMIVITGSLTIDSIEFASLITNCRHTTKSSHTVDTCGATAAAATPAAPVDTRDTASSNILAMKYMSKIGHVLAGIPLVRQLFWRAVLEQLSKQVQYIKLDLSKAKLFCSVHLSQLFWRWMWSQCTVERVMTTLAVVLLLVNVWRLKSRMSQLEKSRVSQLENDVDYLLSVIE